MGNAMLCDSGDGADAAYMITDMIDGGNTLLCAEHLPAWCFDVLTASGLLDAPAEPEPEPRGFTTETIDRALADGQDVPLPFDVPAEPVKPASGKAKRTRSADRVDGMVEGLAVADPAQAIESIVDAS